jgi:hypothetical protein
MVLGIFVAQAAAGANFRAFGGESPKKGGRREPLTGSR